MGALKIDCFLNEAQMNTIIDGVISHIHSFGNDMVEDIDIETAGVRVWVEFDNLINLDVKVAEIISPDGDVLFEDSAVLKSRLWKVIDAYNSGNTYLILQSKQIRIDQLQYC